MGEEPKNENKPEFKGNLGFIWLIGILVILLGCVTIYTLKITADNKELKQAPQTAPVVTETQSQPQVQTPVQAQTTENNSKTTSSTEKTSSSAPAISSIGELVSGERYGVDASKLDEEMTIFRETDGDRVPYFSIEYRIMGNDKRRLKVVNNTTNKTILNEKTDKDIVDIIVNDNRTDKKSFEAVVLFNDGTIGEIKTNKLVKSNKYKNIVRIQEINWKEGEFDTNHDDAYMSYFVIVAVDNGGKVYPVSILSDG